MRQFILFCSLVALAACSRANEIPLILEQTITLPEATEYWDVMPRWDNEYGWVARIGSDDSASFAWAITGSTQNGILYGLPQSCHGIWGYWDGEFTPHAVIASVSGPTMTVLLYDLLSGDTIASRSEWTNSSVPYYYGTYTLYEIILSLPPPMATEHVNASYSLRSSTTVDDFHGGTITTQSFISGLKRDLQNPANSVTSSLGRSPQVSTLWNGQLNIGGGSETCTTYNTNQFGQFTYCNRVIGTTEVYADTVSTVFSRTDSIEKTARVLIYDMFSDEPVIVSSAGSLLYFDDSSSERVEIPNHYSKLFPAYVLLGDYSEQILALDDTTRRFDIIKIEDGAIWGQTSALDPGYNEMKIIGRYNNNYRRLVVRYDNELRIYQFGDPIYTAADDSPILPQVFTLSAYPNPFNPSTSIEFTLPKAQHVNLNIFDVTGRKVATLLNETRIAGTHAVTFDGSAFASGIYFARLQSDDFTQTTKLVLMK